MKILMNLDEQEIRTLKVTKIWVSQNLFAQLSTENPITIHS